MIEEFGIIEEIRESDMDVRIERPEQCDACSIRESCYGRGNVITVPRNDEFRVNDRIHLSIENTSVLGLSAVVYGIPLAALFVGLLTGYYGIFAEAIESTRVLASFALAVVLVAASALAVRLIGRRLTGSVEYHTRRAGDSAQAPVPRAT